MGRRERRIRTDHGNRKREERGSISGKRGAKNQGSRRRAVCQENVGAQCVTLVRTRSCCSQSFSSGSVSLASEQKKQFLGKAGFFPAETRFSVQVSLTDRRTLQVLVENHGKRKVLRSLLVSSGLSCHQKWGVEWVPSGGQSGLVEEFSREKD